MKAISPPTNDITNEVMDLFVPKYIIVVREHLYAKSDGNKPLTYIEMNDADHLGRPINAHPLTELETKQLARTLYDSYADKAAFLRPKQLLADNVLYINPSPDDGYVIWYTPRQHRQLYFAERTNITSGTASVPPLIWVASRRKLQLFSLNSLKKPTADSVLCPAPFPNVYTNGNVCMGNVKIKIPKTAGLEEFIEGWENYFFNSYFSHTIGNHRPTRGDLTELWQSLIGAPTEFPIKVLIPGRSTIASLIV